MTQTAVTVFHLVLFGSWIALQFFTFFFSLLLLHNQMWMSLLGRQAFTPFSHGLSQPIDQCKSKPVTSGHDILWLDFKCVYRSESLCTCRQKHWGCRLTHNARRFQLHLCIRQGPPSFALYENNERHKSTRGRCGLDGTDPLGCFTAFHAGPGADHVSDSSVLNDIQSYYEAGQGIFEMFICDLYLTGGRAFFFVVVRFS